MEIEIFVHGALCMAYSRPLPALRVYQQARTRTGTCTNACRWEYNVAEGKEDDVGNIVHKYEADPGADRGAHSASARRPIKSL